MTTATNASSPVKTAATAIPEGQATAAAAITPAFPDVPPTTANTATTEKPSRSSAPPGSSPVRRGVKTRPQSPDFTKMDRADKYVKYIPPNLFVYLFIYFSHFIYFFPPF